MMGESLLEIKNLSICCGDRVLLKGGNLILKRGFSIGVFGDSGSGKSVFSLFLMGLLNSDRFSVLADRAQFNHNDYNFNLLSKNFSEWNRFRSNYISLVFQDSTASLNPTITCGNQLKEAVFKKNKRSLKSLCI